MFIVCMPYKTRFYSKIFTLTGLMLFVLLFTVIIYFTNFFDQDKLCEVTNPNLKYFNLKPFNGESAGK